MPANSPKGPSSSVHPIGSSSPSSTISASARAGTSIVTPGLRRTGAPCNPPAMVISLTPGGALNAALRISIGCTPTETEIGSGSRRASAAS